MNIAASSTGEILLTGEGNSPATSNGVAKGTRLLVATALGFEIQGVAFTG